MLDAVIPLAECRSCHAFGMWAVTEKNGKPLLIDPEPVEGGNITLIARRDGDRPAAPLAHVTTKAEREQLAKEHEGPLKLFVAHFTTCPDAGDWRKP